MATGRVFKQQRSDRPPVEFTLSGDTVDEAGEYDGGSWSEDFRCLPELPGGALDDLARSVMVDDVTGEQRYNRASVVRFVAAALPEAGAKRLHELVRDKRRIVELDLLGDVMKYINEEFNERPTTP